VPVLRPEDERLQDEEIEGALKELNALVVRHSGREATSTPGVCLLVPATGRLGRSMPAGPARR
jgi:hypothetical protein